MAGEGHEAAATPGVISSPGLKGSGGLRRGPSHSRPRTVRLREGRTVRIRAIRPSDAALLMPSGSTAPATGGRTPAAATAIAATESEMPGHDTLHRDPAGPVRDGEALRQAVEPVDGHHHVGCLRRRRSSPGSHGHTDVGRRQRRRVVYAIADHHRDASGALAPDGIELVRRRLLGQDRVGADRRPHQCGDIRA